MGDSLRSLDAVLSLFSFYSNTILFFPLHQYFLLHFIINPYSLPFLSFNKHFNPFQILLYTHFPFLQIPRSKANLRKTPSNRILPSRLLPFDWSHRSSRNPAWVRSKHSRSSLKNTHRILPRCIDRNAPPMGFLPVNYKSSRRNTAMFSMLDPSRGNHLCVRFHHHFIRQIENRGFGRFRDSGNEFFSVVTKNRQILPIKSIIQSFDDVR